MPASDCSPRIVVIGGGVGGLTTAAVLARAGLNVTVLEAHVYPGGCAGTFFHQGYHFDAGATLAGGFYPGGPMDLVARAAAVPAWPARPTSPAMDVHLPDGRTVTRHGDAKRHAEHARHFGPAGTHFFSWQERTADALWDLALRLPPWPPQRLGEALRVAAAGLGWLGSDLHRLDPRLAADALRPVAAHLADAPDALRQFVDGQLLIAAQATSSSANALYGASALDLPRRGVVHLEGGMGAIAQSLATALRANGSVLRYRQEVTRIRFEDGRPVAVETKRGDAIPADIVIANLPPWNIKRLLGEDAPRRLGHLPLEPKDGWGAFMLYAGVDSSVIAPKAPLHHQVVVREPLGEGNSVFVSVSPAWDEARAPAGRRAVTISTHTNPHPWYRLRSDDEGMYNKRKQAYGERLLDAANGALPGLRDAADLLLPGTPLAFQRFTRRAGGWVGGFPQTNLLRGWGPRLSPNLWMVGDSIFPGQSTAAVALGGLRVAHSVLAAVGAPQPEAVHSVTLASSC